MHRTKIEWRRELLETRARLGAELRRASSRAIVDRVAALPEVAAARTLLLYVAIGAEVDASGLAAPAAGRAVHVPGPVPGTWTPYPGGGSVTQRAGGAPAGATTTAALAAPIVAVVPGVAFDPAGVRLGRGEGFYDRALAHVRERPAFVVGVAFEVQLVAGLPRDPWDQLVDLVVTERRLVMPQAAGRPETPRAVGQEVCDP